MNYLNDSYIDLLQVAKDNNAKYLNSEPFPNISFKNFFNPEILDKILNEFPDLSKANSIIFNDSKQKKFATKGEESFRDETKSFMHKV